MINNPHHFVFSYYSSLGGKNHLARLQLVQFLTKAGANQKELKEISLGSKERGIFEFKVRLNVEQLQTTSNNFKLALVGAVFGNKSF